MPNLLPDATYAITKAIRETLLKEKPIYQNCLNCENFDHATEFCKLANQRPPAKIIVYGCPKWEYDAIPF